MDEQNPNQNGDYQHGYASGIEGLDRQSYETYLSSNVNHDWVNDHLNQKRDQLNAASEMEFRPPFRAIKATGSSELIRKEIIILPRLELASQALSSQRI